MPAAVAPLSLLLALAVLLAQQQLLLVVVVAAAPVVELGLDLTSGAPCVPPYAPSAAEVAQAARSRLGEVFARREGLVPSSPAATLLLWAGVETTRADADTAVAFRQDSHFLYASQVELPDFAVVLEVQATTSGVGASVRSTLVAPERDAYWALWNGVVESHATLRSRYGVSNVVGRSELVTTLLASTGGGARPVYVLKGGNDFDGAGNFTFDTSALRAALREARYVKHPAEVAMIRAASLVSSAAHNALSSQVRPNWKEYNLAARFKFLCEDCGLNHLAYGSIVGSGNRSAILHYTANNAVMRSGDLVLVDAGAELRGYGTDITRTFPVNGTFSSAQRDIHNAVAGIVENVESRLKPGIKWKDMNTLAYRGVCEALLKLGYLKGELEAMIDAKVCGLFLPHGLGHSVGIDVHDPQPSDPVMEENVVFTVEPGIYFNAAFIELGRDDPAKAPFLNLARIDAALASNLGGVRIEDTVLITKHGMENLSPATKNAERIPHPGKPRCNTLPASPP